MSDPIVDKITDEGLGYLILGCFRVVPTFEEFPIKIRGVVDNFDDKGDIENFSIITESGLKYTVSVTFDGQAE
jgi:hypothetical protein